MQWTIRRFSTRKRVWLRGRNENGSFQSPFNPFKWGDAFTEGNSWHYTWSVFHDPAGLAKLMGGYDKFNAMLDSVFQLPPIFDDSYYGFTIHEIREMQIMNMGQLRTWKPTYPAHDLPLWLQRTALEGAVLGAWGDGPIYTAHPDGYCGDEDNGQTSAWYVFSALGFYPVCPGSTQYMIGTPYFHKVKIQLENGKTVTIRAEKNNKDNRFIQHITMDGQPYPHYYLEHEQLLSGPIIDFTMGNKPAK